MKNGLNFRLALVPLFSLLLLLIMFMEFKSDYIIDNEGEKNILALFFPWDDNTK